MLDDPYWRQTLLEAIANPDAEFVLSLDGLDGADTTAKLFGAAQRGAGPLAQATEWEIAQLYGAGRLGDVTLLSDGIVVPNPFAE